MEMIISKKEFEDAIKEAKEEYFLVHCDSDNRLIDEFLSELKTTLKKRML